MIPAMSSADAAGSRAEAIATELNSVAIHLVRRLRREDEALGVGAARLSALSVLVFGGPHTLGQLAVDEQVTAPTMSRIVAALAADGLVARRPDAKDGRVVWLRATAKGRRVMYRGRSRRVSRLASQLRQLDDAEFATLERASAILRRLEVPDAG